MLDSKMKKLWLIVLILFSCKPPRDNPYDPQSPNYRGEIVQGRVISAIGNPLDGVLISTIPVKFSTLTNRDGYFMMKLEVGSWRVVANKNGYAPETTQIELSLAETKEVNFTLNGIPVVKSVKVISCHQQEGWPLRDLFWVDVFAEIYDLDGIHDIDSVRVTVEFDTMELPKHMMFKEKIYIVRIYEDACPYRKLENLLGRPFRVCGIDKKGNIGKSKDFYLPRIIYYSPYTMKPTYIDTIPQNTPIEFVWTRIGTIHPIIYQLAVFYQPTLDTVIIRPNITDTTVTITASLRPAIYLWRVEGMDEFGDISRSRMMSFIIK